jgi:nucleoside-diphosphate-sugar epimerase
MSFQPFKIALTGSSGFVGRMILPSLTKAGHQVVGYDRQSGFISDLLNHRWFLPVTADRIQSRAMKTEVLIGQLQKRIRPVFQSLLYKSSGIDICSEPTRWAQRFTGCQVVIHLAAIPHPKVKGMTPQDYESINYEGAINIYQAARAAGVPRFVYASSCQAYYINRFTGWKHFPVLEEDADAIQEICRPHDYGFLKWKLEQYLLENSLRDGMTTFSLRLEMPGLWGANSDNLYTQTSLENLQQAFLLASIQPVDMGAHILNIADDWTPESLVDLRQYVRQRWPGVPCDIRDNSSILSVEKARNLLGYKPVRNGHYYPHRALF